MLGKTRGAHGDRGVPALVAGAWALLAAVAPAAGGVDWSRYADTDNLEIVTRDEDGDSRETTIWIAVLDGEAYIRTGATTWGDNALRDPEVELVVDAVRIPVRVELVEDAALRERVLAAFHAKYGGWDTFVGWFRIGEPRIMRLEPR